MTSSDALSDEILSALARADELLETGWSIDEICRELRVSRPTYRFWRIAHSRTFVATARRTSTAALVTSAPIPSPGRMRIFRFMFRLN